MKCILTGRCTWFENSPGKGSLVFVQGKIRNTKYEKDGQTVYGTDFIADKVDYLDTKAPGGSNQE